MRHVPRLPPLEVSHLMHLAVEAALATVDPQSSPELTARQVKGYLVRHHHLFAPLGVDVPSDLADLVVTAGARCGHLLYSHGPMASPQPPDAPPWPSPHAMCGACECRVFQPSDEDPDVCRTVPARVTLDWSRTPLWGL